MSTPKQSQTGTSIVWRDAPTTSVNVGGTKFVYRQLGQTPVYRLSSSIIWLRNLTGGTPGSSMASRPASNGLG